MMRGRLAEKDDQLQRAYTALAWSESWAIRGPLMCIGFIAGVFVASIWQRLPSRQPKPVAEPTPRFNILHDDVETYP